MIQTNIINSAYKIGIKLIFLNQLLYIKLQPTNKESYLLDGKLEKLTMHMQ